MRSCLLSLLVTSGASMATLLVTAVPLMIFLEDTSGTLMLVKSCTPVCPDLPVCYMIALFAGTDVDCGGYYPAHAKEAVESGKLDVRYINRGIPYNRESSYCSFGQLVQGPNETWSL